MSTREPDVLQSPSSSHVPGRQWNVPLRSAIDAHTQSHSLGKVHAPPSRTHDCISVRIPQLPDPQVGHARVCVPWHGSISVPPEHMPQAPHEPHDVPSVSRAQASVIIVVTGPHVPPVQRGVLVVLMRVPDSSHVSEKPSHVPVTVIGVPQTVPSVSRVQSSICSMLELPQLPAEHVCTVTVRERVPVSSHTSLAVNMHAVKSVSSVGAQVVSSVSRVQASTSIIVVASQTPSLEQR